MAYISYHAPEPPWLSVLQSLELISSDAKGQLLMASQNPLEFILNIHLTLFIFWHSLACYVDQRS